MKVSPPRCPCFRLHPGQLSNYCDARDLDSVADIFETHVEASANLLLQVRQAELQ